MQPASLKSLFLSIALLLLLAACQQDAQTPDTDPPATDQTASNTETEAITPEPATEQGCTLTMGFDSWEPYQFEASDHIIRGIDVELVQAMASESGCTVGFVEDQWINLLPMLKNGDIDVLAGATPIAERESYAWFSIPYRAEQFELYTGTDAELPAQEFGSLLGQGFRMGLTDGYIYGEPISSAQNNDAFEEQFTYASLAEVNFTNLADGRIDGFLEDPFVTAAIIRRHGWHDQVRATGVMLSNMPVSLMFSRASVSETQLSNFNDTLAKLKLTGSDQEIFKRYLGTDR